MPHTSRSKRRRGVHVRFPIAGTSQRPSADQAGKWKVNPGMPRGIASTVVVDCRPSFKACSKARLTLRLEQLGSVVAHTLARLPYCAAIVVHHDHDRRSPEAVWPWLVHLGYWRAGWYTDDLLDNAATRAPIGSCRNTNIS
jgi:hypothetical protein